MRLPLVAACATLLVLSACTSTGTTPTADPAPSESVGVQLEGSYEPPTGARAEGAPAPAFIVTDVAGYAALVQPEPLGATTDTAAGALEVRDGCLEVALESDPTRYGVVLVGAVGHDADSLVIDGAVLPFGERLELPWADTAPMDEAPSDYRSACPGVDTLFGIGP